MCLENESNVNDNISDWSFWQFPRKGKISAFLLRFEPVLDGFGEVFGEDVVSLFEVGDGAGEFDEAVVGAGGEAHGGNGVAQEVFAGLVEGTELAEERGIHFGIGKDVFSRKTRALNGAGTFDARADIEAFLGVARGFEFVEGDARNLDVKVDSVHNGTGNSRLVARGFTGRTRAETLRIAHIAAGAGIHCGDKNKARREVEGTLGARDRDVTVFERLPQVFEDTLREFAEFIKEEDAAVGEANFSGLWEGSAADKRNRRSAVVGRAEGTGGDEGVPARQKPGDRENFGDFDTFFEIELGEDRREGFGKDGFAASRGTAHEDIVAARSSDFEGAFGMFLAADIFHIEKEGLFLEE